MIPVAEVHTAVAARLRAAGAGLVPPMLVGEGGAPEGQAAASRYVVVEYEPGGSTDGPPFSDDPEDSASIRVRLRSVGVDRGGAPTEGVDRGGAPTEGVARGLARRTSDWVRVTVMDRSVVIEGTTWRVAGRSCEGLPGEDVEGRSANVVDDLMLWVVPR